MKFGTNFKSKDTTKYNYKLLDFEMLIAETVKINA
jgi:hypothetical protein